MAKKKTHKKAKVVRKKTSRDGRKSELVFRCLPVHQNDSEVYIFAAKASDLWSVLQINQREEDKDEGYQRILSVARVGTIARYIDSGNVIAPSILVSFDDATIDSRGSSIRIPNRSDAGWVIDGQHRLAGAFKAESDIELCVVAFIGLDVQSQIRQFVTINREAKGVPTSLYYDLLKSLPDKKPAEVAKERAADIAGVLKRDPDSPFFGAIVVTSAPKKGQLSLTNFVRKVTPLIQEGKGFFHIYTETEQIGILDNYYKALRNVFSKEFGKPNSKFFQTLGFGAFMNALSTVFSITLSVHKGFEVSDVTKVLKEIRDFDVDGLGEYGTGNAAEIQAGRDIETELRNAFAERTDEVLRL